MHEIAPHDRLKKLLDQFEKAGGVVDYVLVSFDQDDPTSYKTHRLAAIEAMQTFARRTDLYFEKLLKRLIFRLLFRNHSRDDFIRIQFDTSKMSATQISLQEFLGPLFDLNSRKLLLRGRSSDHLNSYFYAGEEEQYHTRIPVDVEIGEGYAYVFAEPPYSMDLEVVNLNQLFLDLADELFRGFSAPIAIWQWSTDWSNYFDAGNESWWGSNFWTVYAEGNDFIVGIGASSTD